MEIFLMPEIKNNSCRITYDEQNFMTVEIFNKNEFFHIDLQDALFLKVALGIALEAQTNYLRDFKELQKKYNA